MKILFILLFLFTSHLPTGWSQVPKKKILAAAPETSPQVFKEFLAKNTHYKAFAQHSALEDKGSPWQFKIIQAQNHFLQGSMAKAVSIFKEVANCRHKRDWSAQQRKRILYALFRLAQVTENQVQSRQWIQKALEFSRDIGPDLQKFPPPLLQQWKQQRKHLETHNYALPTGFDKFDLIKVNGKEADSTSGLLRSHGKVQRFSFYSNSHLPFHWLGRAGDLENLTLPLKPLFQGSCKNNPSPLPKDIDGVLFPGLCLKTNTSESVENIIQTQTLKFSEKPKSFWQKNQTILWIGAVVISGIATWQYLEHNKPPSPRPKPVPNPPEFTGSAISSRPIQISNLK